MLMRVRAMLLWLSKRRRSGERELQASSAHPAGKHGHEAESRQRPIPAPPKYLLYST